MCHRKSIKMRETIIPHLIYTEKTGSRSSELAVPQAFGVSPAYTWPSTAHNYVTRGYNSFQVNSIGTSSWSSIRLHAGKLSGSCIPMSQPNIYTNLRTHNAAARGPTHYRKLDAIRFSSHWRGHRDGWMKVTSATRWVTAGGRFRASKFRFWDLRLVFPNLLHSTYSKWW